MDVTCIYCKGPVSLPTAWVLSNKNNKLVIFCGRCAKDFARWYKNRMCQFSHKLKGQTVSFSEAAMSSIKPTKGEK